MTREEIMNRIQDIFRDIFNDKELVIIETSNAEEIEEWDSFNHINLVSAIEKEFEIKFALGELQEVKNIGDMINLMVKEKF